MPGKVILISAPYRDLYGPIKEAAGYYFPLGLGYIASFLMTHGFSVRLFEPEAQRLGLKDIEGIFRAEKPPIVGISSATPNFHNAVEIARLAKAAGALTVLGGVHASALAPEIAEEFGDIFDYVVFGEGEITMLELAGKLEGGASKSEMSGVKGLAYHDGGKVVVTTPRPFISDMDSLPMPARELLPQNIFYPNLHNARYRECLTMMTSRGCPFRCSFCASHKATGSLYRTHSPQYVLDEMEHLRRTYGARQILITDDTFTLNKARLVAICEGMIKRKLNLEWFCFSQVTAVDREILSLMKRAGCYNIGFGVESASPRVLAVMGKPISPEKCRAAFDASRELGLKTQAFFVFGHEKDEQEAKESVDFSIELKPTLAFFNMLVPYPGTRDFERFFGGKKTSGIDWRDFVAIGVKSVIESAPIDLRKLVIRANLRFYLRPSQILRILSQIKTWYELKNYVKGGIALVRQMLSWGKKEA